MSLKSTIQRLMPQISIGLATLGIVSTFNPTAFVVAQTQLTTPTTQAVNFKLAADAKGFMRVPTPPVIIPKTLSNPKRPSGDRGIVCKPGQPVNECDDRVPMIDRRAPWSAIGRIVMRETNGDQYQCTGTLITEDVILTNAHCIVNPDTHQVYASLTFEPNLIDGVLPDPKDRAQIIGGVYGTDFRNQRQAPNPNDWAVAKLDKPLGKKYSVIKWQSLELSVFRDNPDKFTLIGYSFDFPDGEKYPDLRRFKAGKGNTPSKHEKCSITAEQPDGVLVHDCDMRGGASGGPILGWINNEPYIVAINSAELANQRTGIGPENYATNVARVEEWLKQQGQTKK
ncbi:MAG: trypsin-like serine protease [Leptolyngbyaceae cyanobacterium bins.302]|nr:trypsin-like serine protease [Leptolyngbyaceae cyanobacterium bins.302]